MKSHTDQETVRIEIPMGNTQWANAMRLFCPAGNTVSWPPTLSVTDDTLHDFTDHVPLEDAKFTKLTVSTVKG